jgi:type I restriction enzyme S subunit
MRRAPLKHALRIASAGHVPIKGAAADKPADGLFPGYSASGQDVWLPPQSAPFDGPGLVLSAVGARCGKVFLAHGRWGVVANTTVLLPRPGHEPRFLWYLTNDENFWERGVTAQPYVRTSETLQRRIYLPEAEEQRRIADFLDDQVARLDRAIELTRRQLNALEEAQQASVEASVLGLSESGPRVPSSVAWISAAPAAWSVQPIGRKFDVQLGKMLAPDRVGGAHERPYLRNTNVQWDRVDTTDLNVMDFPPSDRSRYAVHPGDLLVCEGGDIGRAAIWDGSISEIYYQKALHRVRARSSTSVRWLLYVLRAAARLGVFSAEGGLSTIAHLTAEQLRAHRIPIPTVEAEKRLIAKLDQRARETRQAIGLLQSRFDLLQERRQALITAAVTGQFDVTTARAVA